MYTPPMFNPDRAASLAWAQARGFGTITAWDGRKPVASPLPFHLAYADDGAPIAAFHVARPTSVDTAVDQGATPRILRPSRRRRLLRGRRRYDH